MKATLEQICNKCKQKIKQGDEIIKNNGSWIHSTCPPITEHNKEGTGPKTENEKTIKPKDPFQESELIVYWASNKAYKKAHEGIENINQLTTQQISAIGQKEGMLTRTLVFTVLELMKINNIKSSYAVKKK